MTIIESESSDVRGIIIIVHNGAEPCILVGRVRVVQRLGRRVITYRVTLINNTLVDLGGLIYTRRPYFNYY